MKHLDAQPTLFLDGEPPAGRDPHDFYPTPPPLARAALARYAPPQSKLCLDPGSGGGVWGEQVRAHYSGRQPVIMGCDLFAPNPQGAYQIWEPADYLSWPAPAAFDLIVGNPPFSLAEAFIRRALAQLAPGGHLIFLLRLSFLGSQGRGLWPAWPPAHVAICVPRPSYGYAGARDNWDTMIVHWQQGHRGPIALEWLDWAPAAPPQAGLFTEL